MRCEAKPAARFLRLIGEGPLLESIVCRARLPTFQPQWRAGYIMSGRRIGSLTRRPTILWYRQKLPSCAPLGCFPFVLHLVRGPRRRWRVSLSARKGRATTRCLRITAPRLCAPPRLCRGSVQSAAFGAHCNSWRVASVLAVFPPCSMSSDVTGLQYLSLQSHDALVSSFRCF